ncbi:MAG: tyrosine-type recombinase/integrase [Acidithiobacillus sp.]
MNRRAETAPIDTAVQELWEEIESTPGLTRDSRLFPEAEVADYRLWLTREVEAADKLQKIPGEYLPYRSFLERLQGMRVPFDWAEYPRERLTQMLHDRILLSYPAPREKDTTRAPKYLQNKELKSRLRSQAKFLQFLSLLIRLGNARELWQCCPPSVPRLLDREPTPFTVEGLEGYPYIQQVGALLWSDLRRQISVAGALAEGRILLSALLYGGLAELAALRALLQTLRSGAQVQHFPRLGWSFLDLEIPMGRGGMRLRRWFPDPISEVLILRYQPPERAPGDVEEVTTAVLKQVLDVYLHTLPKLRGKYLRARDVIKHIPQSLRVELPQYLGVYAQGNLAAHAIRPERWWPYHGYALPAIEEALPTEKDKEDLAAADSMSEAATTEILSEVSEAVVTVPWLQSLRSILRHDNRSLALQDLSRIASTSLPSTLSRLCYGWATHLLKHGSAYRHRLKMVTIRRYVSRLAALMLQLLQDAADIENFRDADWRQLYDDLLDLVETEHQRAFLIRAIREWHQYLVENHRASAMASQDLGGLTLDVIPDARILSREEFTHVKEVIARGDHIEHHVQLPTVLILIAILGFRCGLRRMEVLRLRLMDCHMAGRAVLLIRPFAERSLKSRNATRAIPLYALLEAEELQLLADWVQGRETAGAQPNDYLLVIPEIGHNPIAPETAMSRIHAAMREVTGDERVHFHHLRHSFANHLLWRLTLAQIREGVLPRPWQEDQRDAVQFVERLLGHSQQTRKHLYILASLLGHSGPEISLNHYVHTLDLLLALYLRAPMAASKRQWQAFLPELSQPTLYRVMAREGIDGLLGRLRAQYANRVRIPDEKTPTCQSKGVRVGSLGEDRLGDLWQLLLQGMVAIKAGNAEVWDHLAESSPYSAAQLHAMAARAEEIYGMKGKRGPRHRQLELPASGGEMRISLPPRIRKKADRLIYQSLQPLFWKSLRQGPERVRQVLESYLRQAWRDLPGYFLARTVEDPEDAIAFRQLLFDWGIRPGQIVYVSYDSAQRSVWRQRWREALGLHKGIVIETRQLPDSESAKPWLHIYPRFPRQEKKVAELASPGFTYLLMMGAIVLGGISS